LVRLVCMWLVGFGCLVAVLSVGVSVAAGTGSGQRVRASHTGQNPFLGVWRTVDTPGDGSSLTLTINGGQSSVDLVMHDDYASSCVKAGATSAVASITGTGTINGTTLTYDMTRIDCLNSVSIVGGCDPAQATPANPCPTPLVYDAATDTMSEPDLTSPWARIASSTTATATPVFIVSPTASRASTTPALDVAAAPSPSRATATPTFVLTPIGSPSVGKPFSVAVSVEVLRPPTVRPDSLVCSAHDGSAPLTTVIVSGAAERTCRVIVPKSAKGKTLKLSIRPTYGTLTAPKTVSWTIK